MIYIDFFGGLHGNFLCYCINALDDSVKELNPFTIYGTSHLQYRKKLAVADHYTLKGNKLTDGNVISITCDTEDSLLLALLNFGRAGDYNFDLKNFNINLYSQIKRTAFSELATNLKNKYNVDITVNDSIQRSILRNYFQSEFDSPHMFLLHKVQEQQYDFPVVQYNVRNFYNKDLFIKSLYTIKHYFKLSYTIDIEWYEKLWEQFISKVSQLKDVTYANQVLLSVKNKKGIDINFNILQEAWLNHELEKWYNIPMPVDHDEYFKTTGQIIEYLDKAISNEPNN